MAGQPVCHDAVCLPPVNVQTGPHLQVLPALIYLLSMPSTWKYRH